MSKIPLAFPVMPLMMTSNRSNIGTTGSSKSNVMIALKSRRTAQQTLNKPKSDFSVGKRLNLSEQIKSS